MNDRKRWLNSLNNTGNDMGDIRPGVRSDFEDALIDAVDGCHNTGSLSPFLGFLRTHQGEAAMLLHMWGLPGVSELRNRERAAWMTVHYITSQLKRLEPWYEMSANVLIQNGLKPGTGAGFLNM